MWGKILNYGLIAGIVVGLPMFALTTLVHGHIPDPWGMVIGYTTMLIALSTVFVAIKRYRDQELGGVIGFWRAFGLGLGISVVAGVLYVVSWEIATSLSGLDFGAAYTQALIAQKKAAGVGPEELARFTAEMEAFKVQYANPWFRLPMTFTEIFPVGVIVSLVAAGLMRNPRFLALRHA
jgi:hypothetical protein